MKALLLPACLSLVSLLHASDALVVTKFSDADAEGAPIKASSKELPLADPTGVSVASPSAIQIGKEPIGSWKEPYALFTIKGRDGNEEAAANATLQWDLRSAPGLNAGKYAITYTAAIIDPTAVGGMFRVNFENASGSGGSIHPSMRPLTVLFRGDQVRSSVKGTSSASIVYGTPFVVKMTCDLDANTWSATVDDTPIAENVPFSEAFLSAYPQRKISGLEFGSLGGEGHAPSGAFAISEVKMERLP